MYQANIPSESRLNDYLGWGISIFLHGLIVLLCFFALAWKRQIPPPPEYGMEVNFGMDDQGFGDVEQLTKPGEESNPQQQQNNPVTVEENRSEPEKQQDNSKPITSDVEETVTIAPKPETKKSEPTPVPTPVQAETKPAPKPNAESLFPSTKEGGSSNNNGNKPGTVGDMGKPNGNPDARGIYEGNPGRGRGGSSLDMVGWRWDSKPQITDESVEEGKIVFQVKVDEDGNIISVNVLEKTVSPALVKKYQKEVESLSFSRTSGGNTGEGATGRITFIITSK